MESGCRHGSRAVDAADVSRLAPRTPTQSLDPETAPEVGYDVGYAVVSGQEPGEAVAKLLPPSLPRRGEVVTSARTPSRRRRAGLPGASTSGAMIV